MRLLHGTRRGHRRLKKLIKKSAVEKKPLDGIIIETTGRADPAPVAQTFFVDTYVQSKLYFDGSLSVVGAKHIIQHLDEEKPGGVENEAIEQIAFADRIPLNKRDLVAKQRSMKWGNVYGPSTRRCASAERPILP